MSVRDTIIDTTIHYLAAEGAYGMSMRDLAQKADIAPSAIYHYFKNKDDLLKSVFDHANTELGRARAELPQADTVSDMLKQRIEFQLDHAEEIVAVLKYYLAYRDLYKKASHGVLPPKAYLHMQEVLERGVETGEFEVKDIVGDAQVMTHAVNGFVLEYYPLELSKNDKKALTTKIHSFLLRALKGGDTA